MGIRGQGSGSEDRNKTTKCNTQSFKEVSTIEGIVELLREYKYLSIMDEVAEKVETKVLEFYRDKQPFTTLEVGVILFDMKGSIIGISNSAQTWLNVTKTK